MRALFLCLGLLAAPAWSASLSFSSYHGGNASDSAHDIALLPDGSAWIVGSTSSTDLPAPGGHQTSKGAGVDGFLLKIGADNSRIYGRYINGNGDETPNAVAVDAAGKVYVAGTQVLNGQYSCFVMRFAADGLFEFARIFGGSGLEICNDVAVDGSGSIHIVGRTQSTDLPVTANALQKNPGGDDDALYAVYDAAGNLSYLSYIGGAGSQIGNGIVVSGGYAWLTGSTYAGSDEQAFLVKLNANASFPEAGEFTRTFGGSGSDRAYAVAVDGNGTAYVAGSTTSNNLPVTGPVFGTSYPGYESCLLARYGSDGSLQRLGYGEYVSSCRDIKLQGSKVWLGGFSFPGAYVMRSNTDFGAVEVSATIRPSSTGSDLSSVSGLVVRSTGRALIAGSVTQSNYPVLNGFQHNQAGEDGFVSEIDPYTPRLSLSDCSVAEGAAGQQRNCVFSATLDAYPVGRTEFRTTYHPGTAAWDVDFRGDSTLRTMEPAQRTLSFNVTVYGDGLDEDDEYGYARLTELKGPVEFVDTEARFSVLDDDPTTAQLSISDISVNENAASVALTVGLSEVSGRTVTVAWATANGTAIAGSDYNPASGTLSFAPGETSKTLNISLRDDALDEANEHFLVNLSNAVNAGVADGQGQVILIDQDAAPALSIDNGGCSVSEAAGQCVFVARLSAVSGQNVSFTTQTGDGSARSGADFTGHAATSRVITAGQTSLNIAVPILNDALDESNESFVLTLGSVSNASVGVTAYTGVIVDDDAAPSISVANLSVAEDAGSATLPISLSAPSGQEVRFNYTTVAETASAGSDFTASSGTLVFSPGETSKPITLALLNDALDEDDETLRIDLSAAVNASLASPGYSRITLTDNDPQPTISISSTTVSENAGTASLTVSLSAASGREVRINYVTNSDSATAGGNDYTPTSGTLVFSPGQTSKTVSVTVLEDTRDEDDERLQLTLSSAINANLPNPNYGWIHITDNDAPPSLQVGAVTVDEGAQTAVIEVTLSAVSGREVRVDYATASDTATSGSDFGPVSGSLVFGIGQTSRSIALPILDDVLDEDDETLRILLSAAVNASLPTPSYGQVRIIDNDAAPSLAISGVELKEGHGTARLNVSLSAASGKEVRVQYATVDETAVAGSDYTANSGNVVFSPGQTSEAVEIAVIDDSVVEGDETLIVELSAAVNASLPVPARGRITIRDNDEAEGDLPLLLFEPLSISEGAGTVSYAARLSENTDVEVRVNYSTVNGTALSGSDFTASSGSLVFSPGQSSATLSLVVLDDALDEDDETFGLLFSAPVNASLPSDPTAVIRLLDNDAAPHAVIDDCSLVEGDSGETRCDFRIRLSAPSGRLVRVDWSTALATAPLLQEDFETPALSGNAQQFNAGESLGAFLVENGSLDLFNQRWWQAGSGAQAVELNGVSPGTLSAMLTVGIDADYRLHYLIAPSPGCSGARHLVSYWNQAALAEIEADGSASAQNPGWRSMEAALPRVGAGSGGRISPQRNVQLLLASLDPGACGALIDRVVVLPEGIALPGSDLRETSGSVSFAPGQTASAAQSVSVLGDRHGEREEVARLQPTGGDGVDLAASRAGTLTIIDNDRSDGVFSSGFE